MKVVILAGGLGTRLSEETRAKPKPMVEIGGMPILWHIMKIFAAFNVNEFIICCGYKGYQIKDFFSNYSLYCSDVTFDFEKNEVKYHNNCAESWVVTLVNTGLSTMTGGRLKRVQEYLVGDNEFLFTYGDGVADINIDELIKFHRSHGKAATVTACYPPGRFGALGMNSKLVTSFTEKPQGDGGRINAGFFVLSPSVFDKIQDDETVWEQYPLKSLASDGQLCAYKHNGFWQPMDTIRDKEYLESLWKSGDAPWRNWH